MKQPQTAADYLGNFLLGRAAIISSITEEEKQPPNDVSDLGIEVI